MLTREKPEVVRQPLAVTAQPHRPLDDRFAVRYPRAVALLMRAVWRLPPRSRVRQAMLRRVAQRGIEAANRGDDQAAFALYHPDVEMIAPSELVEVGFDSVYSGREARVGLQRRWSAEWGEFLYLPEELIDLGDGRILVLGRMKGSGLSSGAGFYNDWALVVTISEGQVIREQAFFDRGMGLAAVGLTE